MSEVVEQGVGVIPNSLGNRRVISGSEILTRVGKGVGALSLGTAVRGIGQALLVPVALSAWGELQYGEWILLTGLVSFLSLADLGLQTFVMTRLSASHALGDWEEMRRVLHSALRIQYAVAGGLLTLIGLIMIVFPLDRVLSLRSISGFSVLMVVLLLSLELLVNLPVAVVGGLYRATGLLVRGAMVWTIQQFLTIGVTLALIAGQASFVGLAGMRAGLALLLSAWVIHDLRRFYPWLRIWPEWGTWREGLNMIGPGLIFIVITMVDSVSNQFLLLIIQKMLNGAEVSRFVTHRMLVMSTQVVGVLLLYSVWPELSALHARSEHERLLRVYRSLSKLNLWIVAGITFALLPFMPWIYSTWTAAHLVLDPWTLALLIMRTLIWATWSTSLTFLLSTHRPQHLVAILLSAAVLTGICSLFFVPLIGMRGAALAALLGDICVTAWLVPTLASRCLGDRIILFHIEQFKVLLLGLGVPALLGLALWFLLPNLLLRYLVVVPICGSLALALMWQRLGPGERQLAVDVYRHTFTNGRS